MANSPKNYIYRFLFWCLYLSGITFHAWSFDLELISTKLPGDQYYIENGQIKGTYKDLFEGVADEQGMDIHFSMVPWTRAVKTLSGSENRLLFPLTRLASREDEFQWIAKLKQVDLCFFSFKKENISSLNDARKLSRIIVHRNSSHQVLLKSYKFSNLVAIDNEDEALRIMNNLESSAWFSACKLNIANNRVRRSSPMHSETVWLAGSHAFVMTPKLQSFIDSLRARIKEDRLHSN